MIAIDLNNNWYTIKRISRKVKVLDTTLLKFKTGKRQYNYAFAKILYKKKYVIIELVNVNSLLQGGK